MIRVIYEGERSDVVQVVAFHTLSVFSGRSLAHFDIIHSMPEEPILTNDGTDDILLDASYQGFIMPKSNTIIRNDC